MRDSERKYPVERGRGDLAEEGCSLLERNGIRVEELRTRRRSFQRRRGVSENL